MAADGQWPSGLGPDTICFYFTVDVECAAEEVLVDLRTLFDQHGPGGARTGYRRARTPLIYLLMAVSARRLSTATVGEVNVHWRSVAKWM